MSSENETSTRQYPKVVFAPYLFSGLRFMSDDNLLIGRGSVDDVLCSQFPSFNLLERTTMEIGTKSLMT